jgi:hypothetical protein
MQDDLHNQLLDLLSRYYAAPESGARSLEDRIIRLLQPSLRRWLREDDVSAQDMEDRCQTLSLKLIQAFRPGREEVHRRIRQPLGFARTAAENYRKDRARANSPRRQTLNKLYYLATDTRFIPLFARWEMASEWLFGLRAWSGATFIVTPRYQSFLRDDSPFVAETLRASGRRSLQEIRFPDLTRRFLQWVETPLAEKRLADHLVDLLGLSPVEMREIDDDLERALAAPQEEHERDWDDCWQSFLSLPPCGRAVLMLGMDWQMLAVLTASDPRSALSLLASALQQPEETLYELRLPLEDTEIAALLGTNENHVYQLRHRALKKIKNLTRIPTRL